LSNITSFKSVRRKFLSSSCKEVRIFYLYQSSNIPLLKSSEPLWSTISYTDKRNIRKCLGKQKLCKLEWKMCFHHRHLYSTFVPTSTWKLHKTQYFS
jgi:hypothetical protein